MYDNFDINKKIIDFTNSIETDLLDSFKEIDSIYEHNQLKVLNAFINSNISESHFCESTGYGYTDAGRDKIEEVYAKIFNTEDALVRQQIVSGTHAISLCLSAITRPDNKVLSISGLPYDTIRATLGLNNERSSLKEYNISFDYIDLIDNSFDLDNIKKKIDLKTKLIMIQRSRGYSFRNPLSITQIKEVIKFIKNINKEIIIMVDNCYGEFVDIIEPSDIGADIVCGSLIKNPGGSIARSGGYIVGRKELIELCSFRLTAPGIGKEVGISFNQNRNILHGLYLAPQIVCNSMKIAKLFSLAYEKLGFETIQKSSEKLNDIVVAIKLNDEKKLTAFVSAIQATSPIDSFVKPVANPMPGYDHKVIMAAGNFISGASIELSCDAPITNPYIVYLQGGISYYQGKLALMKTIKYLKLM